MDVLVDSCLMSLFRMKFLLKKVEWVGLLTSHCYFQTPYGRTLAPINFGEFFSSERIVFTC